MGNKINNRIKELFEPTVDKIKKQSACTHKWYKCGEAYYQCEKCDYLADDRKLDEMIFQEKTNNLLNNT